MSEIPNLNLLYEDENGIVACHTWQGKHVIHSELYNGYKTLEDFKIAKSISKAVDEAFKAKGVKELYTWAETPEQEKFNRFLGYEPTGKKVNSTFVDKGYPYAVIEFKKELK